MRKSVRVQYIQMKEAWSKEKKKKETSGRYLILIKIATSEKGKIVWNKRRKQQ